MINAVEILLPPRIHQRRWMSVVGNLLIVTLYDSDIRFSIVNIVSIYYNHSRLF